MTTTTSARRACTGCRTRASTAPIRSCVSCIDGGLGSTRLGVRSRSACSSSAACVHRSQARMTHGSVTIQLLSASITTQRDPELGYELIGDGSR